MLVQSDLHHLWSGIVDQSGALIVVCVLQQLLTQVVAERVSHELHHMLVGLVEYHLNMCKVSILEFSLQEATPVLVFGETIDLALQRLDSSVREPIGTL